MSAGGSGSSWEASLRARLPTFARLATEVEFALGSVTSEIKTHSITSRVKTPESVAEKARRKELANPLAELDDLVGARVVVLFLSDLPKLESLIRETFTIHNADDKISDGDPSTFGYMSVHYVATLGAGLSGPRYDDLMGIRFEIQVRTIGMDAWANVSHYLDYKGESSVPDDLRRDFFALSGLFYVADQHFELFAQRSHESRERAEDDLALRPSGVEVNLDTTAAFLARRYPDRDHADRADISEFVEEISTLDYVDFGTLGEALDRGRARFDAYERQHPPGAYGQLDSFSDLGAARISLAIVDREFAEVLSEGPVDDPIRSFALWGENDAASWAAPSVQDDEQDEDDAEDD
jgi:putative GTP pyrophosphokinase